MSDENKAAREEPSDEAIARRAHQIWEGEGQPAGRNDEHWHRARQELIDAGEGGSPAPRPVQPGFADTEPGMVPEAAPEETPAEGPGGRFATDVSEAPEQPAPARARRKRATPSGDAAAPVRRKRASPAG